MAGSAGRPEKGSSDPGPYSGPHDSVAAIFGWLSFVTAVCGLLEPWLAAGYVAAHKAVSLSAAMKLLGAPRPGSLLVLDLLFLSAAAQVWSVLRTLKRCTASGDASAETLSRTRLQLATGALMGAIAFFEAILLH